MTDFIFQENAGKSAKQKKEELKAKNASKNSDGPKYM